MQQRLMNFVRETFRPGYPYNISKLVGDASMRQYFRFETQSGQSYIMAAYPEPFDPEHFSYKQVYDLFQQAGLPVPTIIAMDGPLGIVVQEDLGNESLQRRLINASPQDQESLLRQSIDLILTIQSRGTEALRPDYEASKLAFDEEKLKWELEFFRKNYLINYRQVQPPDDSPLTAEFGRLATELAACPRVLCHRDYHIRNLMFRDGQLYIIDFQDARWGPPSYDLASLLKDSIGLEEEQTRSLIDYYLERSPQSAGFDDFQRQFHLMCVQRLLKALGTYAYQITVRNHYIYEQYVEGSLRRALISLRALDEFPYIGEIVEKETGGEVAQADRLTAGP